MTEGKAIGISALLILSITILINTGRRASCRLNRELILQCSNQVDKANAYYYDCMESKQ